MPTAVVAVFAFLAFWVVVAIGLFYVASRGGLGVAGPKPDDKRQPRMVRTAISTLLAIVYVAFGVVVPLVVLTDNHSNASAQVGSISLTADEKGGRDVFAGNCAVCHTLSAAHAIGKVGPNLDQIRPAQALVLNTVVNGCLPNAPSGSPQQCLGQGVMDGNLVQGKQARQVAEFVSKVAGH